MIKVINLYNAQSREEWSVELIDTELTDDIEIMEKWLKLKELEYSKLDNFNFYDEEDHCIVGYHIDHKPNVEKV